jgi:hypothetical protein
MCALMQAIATVCATNVKHKSEQVFKQVFELILLVMLECSTTFKQVFEFQLSFSCN